MSFNYEQSIWGKGTAGLSWSDPASFRLKQAIRVVDNLQTLKSKDQSPKVLEVGCGAGQFIRAIKKFRPEAQCYGCDISDRALERAQKANDGVVYSHSGETLPYGDQTFDAVLIFDVLEHLADPKAMLGEAGRVLKPGGFLYCFAPCEGDTTSLWNLLDKLSLKRDLTKKYAGHIQYFSRQSLFNLFKSEGFNVDKIRYSEHFFGQILGVIAFILMDRAAGRQRLAQINNEDYFNGQGSGIMNFIKSAINSLIFFESTVLQSVPSPNVHIILRKNS